MVTLICVLLLIAVVTGPEIPYLIIATKQWCRDIVKAIRS